MFYVNHSSMCNNGGSTSQYVFNFVYELTLIFFH